MKTENVPSRTIDSCLAEATRRLSASGSISPRLDARLLMARAVGVDQSGLISGGREMMPDDALEKFSRWIDQRVTGVPVHRILGGREFYGRWFQLNDDTLEPRPETELLIDRIVEDYRAKKPIRFADVGTGSGIIAITLLLELAGCSAVASDISPGALAMATMNADILGVGTSLDIVETDCLVDCAGPFEFIVSNPPYIPSQDIDRLSIEVRNHDPMKALDGGLDGLSFYRKLLPQAKARLVPGGRLYLETGHGQHGDILAMAKEGGWKAVSTQLDLNGLERVIVLAMP